MGRVVNLSSGAYTAKINLSRGANCIALRNAKYQATILREPNYDALDNPYLYGMPILYPNNHISDGKFLLRDGNTFSPSTSRSPIAISTAFYIMRRLTGCMRGLII